MNLALLLARRPRGERDIPFFKAFASDHGKLWLGSFLSVRDPTFTFPPGHYKCRVLIKSRKYLICFPVSLVPMGQLIISICRRVCSQLKKSSPHPRHHTVHSASHPLEVDAVSIARKIRQLRHPFSTLSGLNRDNAKFFVDVQSISEHGR